MTVDWRAYTRAIGLGQLDGRQRDSRHRHPDRIAPQRTAAAIAAASGYGCWFTIGRLRWRASLTNGSKDDELLGSDPELADLVRTLRSYGVLTRTELLERSGARSW
jgi:hypothetical protein